MPAASNSPTASANSPTPIEQRRRFEAEMDLKEQLYGERYPIDEELLQALRLMPPASGVALGLDRLIMLATGRRMTGVDAGPDPGACGRRCRLGERRG